MCRGMSSSSYGALLESSVLICRRIGVQGADRGPDVLLVDYVLPSRRQPMRGPWHLAPFGRRVRRTGQMFLRMVIMKDIYEITGLQLRFNYSEVHGRWEDEGRVITKRQRLIAVLSFAALMAKNVIDHAHVCTFAPTSFFSMILFNTRIHYQ